MTEPYVQQVFSVSSHGRYFLQGFNKSLYSLVVISEFNLSKFCCKKWKEILTLDSILIESKYENSLNSEFLDSPIIIISKFEPPISLILKNKLRSLANQSAGVEIIRCHDELELAGNGKDKV